MLSDIFLNVKEFINFIRFKVFVQDGTTIQFALAEKFSTTSINSLYLIFQGYQKPSVAKTSPAGVSIIIHIIFPNINRQETQHILNSFELVFRFPQFKTWRQIIFLVNSGKAIFTQGISST